MDADSLKKVQLSEVRTNKNLHWSEVTIENQQFDSSAYL
jgi:hypothetical protein